MKKDNVSASLGSCELIATARRRPGRSILQFVIVSESDRDEECADTINEGLSKATGPRSMEPVVYSGVSPTGSLSVGDRGNDKIKTHDYTATFIVCPTEPRECQNPPVCLISVVLASVARSLPGRRIRS